MIHFSKLAMMTAMRSVVSRAPVNGEFSGGTLTPEAFNRMFKSLGLTVRPDHQIELSWGSARSFKDGSTIASRQIIMTYGRLK